MINVEDISKSGILKYTVRIWYSTIFDDSCQDTLEILAKSDESAMTVAKNQIKLHYQSVNPEIKDVSVVSVDFIGTDGYLGGLD